MCSLTVVLCVLLLPRFRTTRFKIEEHLPWAKQEPLHFMMTSRSSIDFLINVISLDFQSQEQEHRFHRSFFPSLKATLTPFRL